jgi:hypothetical protein
MVLGLKAGCAREQQPGVLIGEHLVVGRGVLSTAINVVYITTKVMLTLR